MTIAALIVAEHAPATGLGHLRRSLALGAALRACGATVTVVSFGPSLPSGVAPTATDVVIAEDPRTDETRLARIRDMARGVAATRIVIDVARMGDLALQGIRRFGARVAVVGEPTEGPIPCDLLIHASATVGPAAYAARVPSGARVLLGPDYAVVRPEVTAHRAAVPPTSVSVRRIFVGLGGGEVSRDSARVLEGLRGGRTRAQIDLLVPSLSRRVEVEDGDETVRVHAGGEDPIRLVTGADLAVTSGGVMSLEAACLGIPTLIVVRVPNQRSNAEILSRGGAARNAGPVEALNTGALAAVVDELGDPTVREGMRQRGRALVDGLGAERVARELLW